MRCLVFSYFGMSGPDAGGCLFPLYSKDAVYQSNKLESYLWFESRRVGDVRVLLCDSYKVPSESIRGQEVHRNIN